MSTIQLESISKEYADGYKAVSDLNLDIRDGELMILVGPSGCGKSTALNMIAGLEDITGGQLKIDGEVVNQRSPRDRDIAMVFQSYALYPHMNVRQNMAFSLKLQKVDKAEIDRKVTEAARILDLEEHLDRKPSQLSGGQRQRVAMGRAIVRQPKAFLMDEPLSNLDAKLRVQMRTEVARIQRQLGVTMVYVTHDQTEAMTLGDRVAVMRLGKLQQVDTPMNLYAEPANIFVAGFIGSPGMNFMPARVAGGNVELPMATVPLPESLRGVPDGKQVIAGIRPEHLEDAALVPATDRDHGTTFRTKIEVLEAMGSEFYAHFTIAGQDSALQGDEIADLRKDSGLDEVPGAKGGTLAIARINAESRVEDGAEADLWIDGRKLQLFDPENGLSLKK